MTSNLLIRNLTSLTLRLRQLETVEEHGLSVRAARGWWPASSRSSSPARPPNNEDLTRLAAATTQNDLDVVIDPFELGRVDSARSNALEASALRVTLEAGKHQYRLLVDPSSSLSQSLKPLTFTGSKGRNLSSIFLPSDNCLTIIDSTVQSQASTWMSTIPDSIPLSLLSIPGTHNSAACYKALPSVRCQVLPVDVQLDNGIRFFDVRVQITSPSNSASDILTLVHSIWPVSMSGTKYFRPLVMDKMEAFLRKNPTETIIMSLKREGTGAGTDELLSLLIQSHYVNRDPDMWWTSPRMPLLGEARGKIVLLRRFNIPDAMQSLNAGRGWSLDARSWENNTECDYHGCVCVQDRYVISQIKFWEEKVSAVTRQLERSHALKLDGSSQGPPGGGEFVVTLTHQDVVPHLHLNFASASNFFRSSCWPDRIAAKLNPAVLRYLCLLHGIPSGSSLQRLHSSQETHEERASHLLQDDGAAVEDALQDAGDGDGASAVGTQTHGSKLSGSAESGSTGVVILDWVGADGNWDLVNCIIAMNGRLRHIIDG